MLPNGMGTRGPSVENTAAAAIDGQAPQAIILSALENLRPNAEMSSQAQVPGAASEIPSWSPAVPPSLTSGNAEQGSQNQPTAAQVSPAVVVALSPPAASAESVSQVAAASSSQPAQKAPADPKVQLRPVTQPQSPLKQETLSSSSSSLPAILSASSAATARSLASHDALPGPQSAPSAVSSPAQADGTPSSVPATPATANTQTVSRRTMATAENSLAVPTKSNPASQQPGKAPVSTPGAQDLASSAATPSQNGSGGNSSDSQQHKDSPSAAVTAADSLPLSPSPAFTIAAPSAQSTVPQPSPLPEAGPKSNPQTSAGVPDNGSHPSLPATAEAPTATAASPLQVAQVASKAGQSEMRIGLTTAEFGSVEVRTTVHSNDVGVQIASEKGDLRSLLAPELPGIASTLQQQDLRLGQVSFHQQGFAFAGNSSFSGGNSQPRSFSSRPQPAVASSEESSGAEPVRAFEPAVGQRGAGLSILA